MRAQSAPRLIRSASALVPAAAMPLQRRCACGQHTIGGASCDACRGKQRFGKRGAAARDHNKGVTRCVNGELKPEVLQEHKVGNCVRVHEDAHASDPVLAEACRRVTKCHQRGDGGIPADQLDPSYPQDMIGNLCRSTYDNWHQQREAMTELRAYTAEAACLRETIDGSCGAGQSRAGKIGGTIGAIAMGIGGGVGGAVGGVALGRHLSRDNSDMHTGLGIAGGVLGSGIGAGLGWLIGKAIGEAAAGKQGSEEGCKMIKGELEECDIAIKDYTKRASEVALPFEPDGRIRKDLIQGSLKPGASLPGTAAPMASAPGPQGGRDVTATAARATAGHRGPARRFGDLTSIPPRSSPAALAAAPRIYRHSWGGAP